MHVNKTMITDVLKGELGFGGFVASDFNGCLQLGLANQDGLGQCLNAGIDMFMTFGQTIPTMLGYFANLLKAGTITQDRIDDAVRRIVAVKCELGLFEASGKSIVRSPPRSAPRRTGRWRGRRCRNPWCSSRTMAPCYRWRRPPRWRSGARARTTPAISAVDGRSRGRLDWQWRDRRDQRAPGLRGRDRCKPSEVFRGWVEHIWRQCRHRRDRRDPYAKARATAPISPWPPPT